MLFTLKLYPQTIWGETFRGDYEKLLDEILSCGIKNIICPVFQGSRLFYPEQKSQDQMKNPWNLLELQELCHARGVGFIPQFPVFHDPDTYENVPQYRPVNLKGETGYPSDWYKPICPSNEPYRQYRLNLIYEAMQLFHPPLASLAFLHYPYQPDVQSQDQNGTTLPMYCYCDFCRYQYLDFSGHANPLEDVESWYRFRAENLTLIPISILEELEKSGENVKILVENPLVSPPYVVEKLRRVTGQDFQQWRGLVDILSPHLPIFQLGSNIQWIDEYIEEFLNLADMKLMPEIDLPASTIPRPQLAPLRTVFDKLVDRQIETIALFHAGLLLQNEPVKELIQEYTEA